MSGHRAESLDPRAWLLWAVAASLPAMLGRNPWPLLELAAVVAAVRVAWSGAGSAAWSRGVYVRLAVIFAVIGVLFNVMTVRAGDRELLAVPEAVPLLSGEVTLNAAVYGALGGLALVLLVLIGSTVAGLLDWTAIVRLLPASLTGLAVAGSVAFALLPQTAEAFREIREAQAARGHRLRGGRDLLPIVVPVLASGLDRAVTLSEALESRGFGGTAPSDRARWRGAAVALGTAAATVSAYAVAAGRVGFAATAAAAAAGCFLILTRQRETRPRTRYRESCWEGKETVVAAGAVAAILATLATLELNPSGLRYEPYPRLTVPRVELPLLIGLLGLLAPAFVASGRRRP